MNQRWFSGGCAVAAIAILIAVAASRPPSEEPVLRARIAGLRAEVAQLRTAQGGASEAPAPNAETATPWKSPVLASRVQARHDPRLRAAGTALQREEKLSLLRDLAKGSDPSLKSRALSLLRGLHGPDAAAVAVAVLQGDGPSWLRAQAASVLGEIDDPSALPALLEASRSDDLDLRASAASSLDRFGHSGPLQELIIGLVEMLDHADGAKREDAVFLLSSLQTPSTMPALLKALGDRTNSRVREAAAEALGRSKLTPALPSLEAALQDPEPRVRDAARAAIDALK
jgi:HEAT repeat protein